MQRAAVPLARGVDRSGAVRYPSGVRRAFRWLNAAVALATLASAVAVLVSDLTDAGYRAHYHDALWFVGGYAAVQAVMLVGFLCDGPHVRWLALARAVAAYLFLLSFTSLWPYWRFWTPARYVYLLFEMPSGSEAGEMALVFLGRGAFNALSLFVFTADWWQPLRRTRPLLGRAVTALPIGVVALCVWAFVTLVQEEQRTFSPEAHEIAEIVFDGIDCDSVRANTGQTTTDIRKRGDRTYGVSISYGCELTRVLVHAEDGRVGTVAGARPDCCDAG